MDAVLSTKYQKPDPISTVGIVDTKTLGPHKLGCLMAILPADVAKIITDWTLESVPDFHLTEEGREPRPHVTCLYGFKDSSPTTIDTLKALLANVQRGPITLRLQGLSLFTGGKDGDVLKADVDSPDLHRLHAVIKELFPIEDKYPTYQPHMTLAFLRPEISASYIDLPASFVGQEITIDSLEWSGADGVREDIPLTVLPQMGTKHMEPQMPAVEPTSYFQTCPRDETGHCLSKDEADRSGQKEGGISTLGRKKDKTGTVVRKVGEQAAAISFSDQRISDPFSDDFGDRPDDDVIEAAMTPGERASLEDDLLQIRDEAVAEQTRDLSPDVDAYDIAYGLDLHQNDIKEHIDKLIAAHIHDPAIAQQAEAKLDDWQANTSERRMWGTRGIRSAADALAIDNLPESFIQALDAYENESEQKLTEGVERAEQDFFDQANEDALEDYDDSDDRRQLLRDFYRDNEDRFHKDGWDEEEQNDRTWYQTSDGRDWWYRFKTSAGKAYFVNIFDKRALGEDFQEVQFKDENESFSVTGAGNAHEVFSNVVPAIVAFVQREHPNGLYFSAAEASRRRLYDRLVKSVAQLAPEYSGIAVEASSTASSRSYLLVEREKRDAVLEKIQASLPPRPMARSEAKVDVLVKRMPATLHTRWWDAKSWEQPHHKGRMEIDTKAMSAYAETSGGALVSPPAQVKRRVRKSLMFDPEGIKKLRKLRWKYRNPGLTPPPQEIHLADVPTVARNEHGITWEPQHPRRHAFTKAMPQTPSTNASPFSGTQTDSLGRHQCYQQGEHVACHGKPATQPKQGTPSATDPQSPVPVAKPVGLQRDALPPGHPDPARNTIPIQKMTPEQFAQKVHVFKTAQGSIYAYANGQTVRIKTPHVGHLTTDTGLKEASNVTYFIKPEDAREVGAWQSMSASGKRVMVRGNEIWLTSPNAKTGERGLDKKFTYQYTPKIGMAPLELFGASSEGPNTWRGTHPGNPITEAVQPTPEAHRMFVQAAEKAGYKSWGSNMLTKAMPVMPSAGGSSFDEDKHPRGQPENAGQFVEKGKDSTKNETESHPDNRHRDVHTHALLERAQHNYTDFRDRYLQKNGTFNERGELTSVLLNTDDWRDLFPEYVGTNADLVQDAASYLNGRLYNESLHSMRGKGNNQVLFLAGGGGSGKGSIGQFMKETDYPIRVDQVSDDLNGLEGKIHRASQAGFGVDYVFVDRPPQEAWTNGVIARALISREQGKLARTVPIHIAVPANIKARKVAIAKLKKLPPDHPVCVIDNSRGFGNARLLNNKDEALAHLESQQYDEQHLLQELTDETIRLYESGKIPQDIAAGLVGQRAITTGRHASQHGEGKAGSGAAVHGSGTGGVGGTGAKSSGPAPAGLVSGRKCMEGINRGKPGPCPGFRQAQQARHVNRLAATEKLTRRTDIKPLQLAPRTNPHDSPATNTNAIPPEPAPTTDASISVKQVLAIGSEATKSKRRSLGQSPIHAAKNLSSKKHANDAVLLTLADGSQGVFKSQMGEAEGLRSGVPDGTQYRREVAASLIADVLGLSDLVPTTTFRQEGGEFGSIQDFVDNTEPAFDVARRDKFDGKEDAARAAVFDYIIGHMDRHSGNWLLKENGSPTPKIEDFASEEAYETALAESRREGANGYQLVLIDNGLSFPVKYHEQDFFNLQFWKHAVHADLPMPDVSHWRDKWPQVEQALRTAGLEDDAIALTQQRFDTVTQFTGDSISDLPNFVDPYDNTRLGDLVELDESGRRRQ